MTLILPAVNLGERVRLLAGMHSAVPTDVIEKLTGEARWRIGPEIWQETMVGVRAALRATPAEERA